MPDIILRMRNPSEPPLPDDLRLTRRPDGEEFVILPPREAARLSGLKLAGQLWFTGGGHYPKAAALYRDRPHGHPEYMLIYCVAGAGQVTVAGRRMELAKDQVLLLPPGVPHTYGPRAGNPWTIHWLSFNGPSAAEYAGQMPAGQYILPVATGHRAEALRLFGGLHALLQESLSDAHLICASKAAEHLLSRFLFHARALGAGKPYDRDPVACGIALMRDRLHGTVTLAELSRAAHLSDTHFSRLFRQRTGHAPVDYFLRLKVQCACQYLGASDRPVKAVARHLGYADVGYFSRMFKKVMGLTPRQYRLRA